MVRYLAGGFLLAALAGCSTTGPTTVRLGEEFVLAPTESVEVEGTGLSIAFRRVIEDSRCPVDVFCVAAGNGSVELQLFGSAEQSGVILNTTTVPQTWSDGIYEVRLIELEPVRKEQQVVKPEDYRARLLVMAVPQ